MFGVADYGAFVIAIIVFLLIPGPGNLALITSTGKGGIRGGLAATVGLETPVAIAPNVRGNWLDPRRGARGCRASGATPPGAFGHPGPQGKTPRMGVS